MASVKPAWRPETRYWLSWEASLTLSFHCYKYPKQSDSTALTKTYFVNEVLATMRHEIDFQSSLAAASSNRNSSLVQCVVAFVRRNARRKHSAMNWNMWEVPRIVSPIGGTEGCPLSFVFIWSHMHTQVLPHCKGFSPFDIHSKNRNKT